MKLYLITFKEVDYEEDYAVLVSARSEAEAIEVAEIKDGAYVHKMFSNSRFKDNIESIELLGTSYKNEVKEILSSNRGA